MAASRISTNRPRRAAVVGAAAAVVAVVVLGILLIGGRGGGPRGPLAYGAAPESVFEQAAADGLSHVIYAKSPGGVLAAARRTAAFRTLVEAAARTGPIDADTLEAIVMLESSGRPDVVAGADPSAAAGLTQIVASTATSLLGMHVDLAASRRLAARLAAAPPAAAAGLRAARARADQRFDPAAALAATERYLAVAVKTLGRGDLAVESYHMGIGNLQTALRRFSGSGNTSYAQLYLDSTPLTHPTAYAWLAGLGDDSATYLWRVYAARRIMRLYRSDPAALAREAHLQAAAPSAELALRPPDSTPVFADAAAVAAARRSGALVAVGAVPGVRTGGRFHLRADALAVVGYIGSTVQAIAHTKAPLELNAATTDRADLTAAARAAHGLGDRDALHATGYAFDVARAYATPEQALALQFVLDRLQALDVIAWQRHARIIHVVAGPRAALLHRGSR